MQTQWHPTVFSEICNCKDKSSLLGQKFDEVLSAHAVRNQSRDCSYTCPEQINLRLSLATTTENVKHHLK